jgi:uncharacterized protein YigA (DUF484 family)
LRDSQREFLFGSDAGEVGSVALVPLGTKGSLGLLACGSNDPHRFNPTMSTDFLTHVGDRDFATRTIRCCTRISCARSPIRPTSERCSAISS